MGRFLLGLESQPALPEKWANSLLCATSECSVSLWFTIVEKNNHRDTENTEVAQRRSRIRDFRAKPVRPQKHKDTKYKLILISSCLCVFVVETFISSRVRRRRRSCPDRAGT